MTPTGQQIWMSGRLVPWADANVHVLTHALHYGTGVFDSLRAYATADGPALFRHREHHERLHRSARLYGMELRWDVDELIDATRALVASTGLDEAYVRTIAYRGAGPMGVSPRGCPVELAIAVWDWPAYLPGAADGIRVKVSSWARIGHDALLPAAKATAHYLNSVLARTEAEELGYDEAILLGADGMLAEGTGENLFLVADGVLPAQTVEAAEISTTRVEPETFVPPLPGAAVRRAVGAERDHALMFDAMERKLPIGVGRDGMPVYANVDFLDGTRGAHVNISGVSGVATKTTYATFLLYSMFRSGVLGAEATNTKALIFNVKGEDLLWLDKPNAKLTPETRAEYDALVASTGGAGIALASRI